MQTTPDQMKKEAAKMLADAKKLEQLQALEQINKTMGAFKADLDAKEWAKKTKAYTDFMEAQALVLARKNAIQSAGLKATDDQLRTESDVLLKEDNSVQTFDKLRIGTILHIKNYPYLILSGTESFSGNSYQLQNAAQKAWILKEGEKQNPYNFQEVAFAYSSNTLTVAKGVNVNQDHTILIGDQRFKAVASIGAGTGAVKRYELEQITD